MKRTNQLGREYSVGDKLDQDTIRKIQELFLNGKRKADISRELSLSASVITKWTSEDKFMMIPGTKCRKLTSNQYDHIVELITLEDKISEPSVKRRRVITESMVRSSIETAFPNEPLDISTTHLRRIMLNLRKEIANSSLDDELPFMYIDTE
jgi:hypothetical protein